VSVPQLLPGTPPELVVYDKPQRCPYLAERTARMPLRLPARPLDREELDARLAAGDRRQGLVLYRTACPSCAACEPIRLDTLSFEFSASHRRILRRGDRDLTMTLGVPESDSERVALYNHHKAMRGLDDGQAPIDEEGYQDFLVSSCCDSFELRYRHQGQLVGLAIADRGARSLSAVYCSYDPAFARYSIGTYSILKQLELCRVWGLRYLYLGLYIKESPKMAYKAGFLPHQRLEGENWKTFSAPLPGDGAPLPAEFVPKD
jgi:arginine-tRNA-protein transferase